MKLDNRMMSLLACGLLGAACGREGGTSSGAPCVDTLLPGDLVITEVFANPSGADGDGVEWFEIYNASAAGVDLRGVTLESAKSDSSGERSHDINDMLTLWPGEYLVVAGVLAEIAPAYVDYAYEDDLGALRNSDGLLRVRCRDLVIDEVTYESAPDSKSLGFNGARPPDAVGNDDPMAWCAASTPFDGQQAGTPGAQNDACATSECTNPVMPGDLIVTEVFANPVGVDGDGVEWFEIYNTSSVAVDFAGLAVGTAQADGSSEKLHAVQNVTVPPGVYAVFGSADAAYVDHVYGSDLGALRNSGGGIVVKCGDTLIDAATYGNASDGRSQSLGDAPDAGRNDLPENWCDSETPIASEMGAFGTPQMANEACGGQVTPGQCDNNGVLETITAPPPGSVIITELMADPDAVSDADGEWLELNVTADIKLNGLQLGFDDSIEQTFDNPDCINLAAGSYVVIARSDDPATNGLGAAIPVAGRLEFSLTNGGGRVFVAYDGQTLDEITYPGSSSGRSRALDPGSLNVTDNDVDANWCEGEGAFGAGDQGTPGALNTLCGGMMMEGQCMDGGAPRPLVRPVPGDLIITELMADPDSPISDTDGEFVEAYVTRDVDLSGLVIGEPAAPALDMTEADVDFGGRGSESQVVSTDQCHRVTAGLYVVFTASSTSGVTQGTIFANGIPSLRNSGLEALYLATDDAVLDVVSYSGSSAGISRSLTSTASDNNPAASWCDADVAGAGEYTMGNIGTPGAVNPACP